MILDWVTAIFPVSRRACDASRLPKQDLIIALKAALLKGSLHKGIQAHK